MKTILLLLTLVFISCSEQPSKTEDVITPGNYNCPGVYPIGDTIGVDYCDPKGARWQPCSNNVPMVNGMIKKCKMRKHFLDGCK
jgi:hypothetical protein